MVEAIVEMPRRPSDSQVCFLCTCSFFNRFSTTSSSLDARLAFALSWGSGASRSVLLKRDTWLPKGVTFCFTA